MKNKSRFIVGLFILSVLGAGCKKSVLNEIRPSKNNIQALSAVSTTKFQVTKNDAKVGYGGVPHLLFKNKPASTAQFVIVMDGIDKSKQRKAIWIATGSGSLTQTHALGFGLPQSQIDAGDLKILQPFFMPVGMKSPSLEVFAIGRVLSEEELNAIKFMTRDQFKIYCLSHTIPILEEAVAKDFKKAVDAEIKFISSEIRKKEAAIHRAEFDKSRAQNDLAAEKLKPKGKVTTKEQKLNTVEIKLSGLKSELVVLKNQFEDLMKQQSEV